MFGIIMYVHEPQKKGQDLNRCHFLDMGHQHTSLFFLSKNRSSIKCRYAVFVGDCLEKYDYCVSFQCLHTSGLISSRSGCLVFILLPTKGQGIQAHEMAGN